MFQRSSFEDWNSTVTILYRGGVTAMAKINPRTSTRMCRLRPLTLFPASYPDPSAWTLPSRFGCRGSPPWARCCFLQSNLLRERIVNDLHRTVLRPSTVRIVHRFPWREVMRKKPPRTTRPGPVPYRIQDLTARMLRCLQVRVGDRGRHERFKNLPFC